MTMNGKAICVYCSSSDALDPAFYEAADALGSEIAAQGCTLVYGGGRTGLMGAVARAVQASGGRVVGVIPQALAAHGYAAADETITTRDLRERKAIMESRADAFIGMPGGFGTLEEVLEVLTLKQLRFHDKPIVLLNTLGYYDHLIKLFEHIYEQRFAKAAHRQLYHVAPDARHALAYIQTYQPPDIPAKWFEPAAERQMSMKGRFEVRQQRAIEQVTGDVSLTDNMTDEQAARVLEWASRAANWIAVQTADMADADAEAYLQPRQEALRRVVRRLNKLLGELPDLGRDEIAEALARLFEPVASVPELGCQVPSDLDGLAARLESKTPDEALAIVLTILTGEITTT